MGKSIGRSAMEFVSNIELYPYPLFILIKGKPYQIKGHHQREIIRNVKPGDLLLRAYQKFLGGIFLPGYWDHVGIYIGSDTMVHMTFDGMISEDILSFLRADDILILRHPDKSLAVTAVEKAIDYSTKVIEYDHGFDFTDRKRFSCTEFTDVVYGGLEYNPDLENESTFNKLARRFYKSVILPDDLLFSSLSVAWRK